MPKVFLQIRIPEELKDRYQKVCKENYTTMTAQVVQLIREYVENHENKDK